MKKIKILSVFFLGLGTGFTMAQEVEITGKVVGEDGVENIHVINRTSKHFTITNAEGRFRMNVNLKDTLTFSAVQYKPKQVIVNEQILSNKALEVFLEVQVTSLDEVVVGKVMIGDLESDMKNFEETPDLNFYDVGIPGYKGKPKTQQERRLNEATTGGGIIPLNPIINAITGRTKRLKEYVKLERRDDLLYAIISRLGEDFLSIYPLDEDHEMDFFYFCSDAPDFELRCKNKSDIEVFEYLVEKYKRYQDNIKNSED